MGLRSGRFPVFPDKSAKLALFSPSGPKDQEESEAGLKMLKALGASAGPPPPETAFRPYLSGPDSARLRLFLEGMEDEAASALLAVRGGYGAMRLLPALRTLWDSFPPKPLIGFSDITALHLARLALSGRGGWHAPNLCTLGRLGLEKSREAFSAIFGGKRSPWAFPKDSVHNPGSAGGSLSGGNLTLFSQLYCTPYFPESNGAVLLFEDVNEKPYVIDRMLLGLTLRGAFKGAKAVVFGSFEGSSDPFLVQTVLADFAAGVDFPVLSGAPFGHGAENEPWFYGEAAEITSSADGAVLSFKGA